MVGTVDLEIDPVHVAFDQEEPQGVDLDLIQVGLPVGYLVGGILQRVQGNLSVVGQGDL